MSNIDGTVAETFEEFSVKENAELRMREAQFADGKIGEGINSMENDITQDSELEVEPDGARSKTDIECERTSGDCRLDDSFKVEDVRCSSAGVSSEVTGGLRKVHTEDQAEKCSRSVGRCK